MARQPILLGTVPNGDGGDTLRQSNTKINQMTEELYATDAAQAASIQGLQDAESSASGRLDVLEQGATGTGQAIEGLQDNLEIAQTAIGELESSREFTLVAGDNIDIDRTNPLAPVISSSGGGGPGGVAWGGITGTLADQTDLAQALAGKVAVEAGKGLSANDYTTPEKTKLASIAEGAQVNVGTNLTQGTRTDTTVGITSSTGTGATLDPASPTQAGVMTAADRVKLDGVGEGAQPNYPEMPQDIAEGGSDANLFSVTALRIRQAILGWWDNSSFKTKLDTLPAAPVVDGKSYVLKDRTWIESLSSVPAVISGQIGTAAVGSPAITAPAKIPFNEFWATSPDITYDATNRRFYIAKAGVYQVRCNIQATTVGGNRLMIGLNTDAPTTANHRGQGFGPADQTIIAEGTFTVAAGDYVVFYISNGGSYNDASNRWGQFSIEKVG